MRFIDLQVPIATTQTTLYSQRQLSDFWSENAVSYLYREEEKVEVEVTSQDIFVGRGHENTAKTVGEDRYHWAVGGSC